MDNLIRDRNNVVLGKSISSLTYVARSRDYHSFKKIQMIDDKVMMSTIRSQINNGWTEYDVGLHNAKRVEI